jgi:hypothetical protein
MEEKLFGFKPSQIDGTERIYGSDDSIELPERYTYRPYLPQVIDQGSQSICVPCTVSAYLNWRENLKDGETKDNKISLYDIYDSRTNGGEGMTYKDAFKFLRKEGVNSKKGLLKITSYSLVRNAADLRQALVMNGPCFGALPVYSDRDEFWRKEYSEGFMGYHAIAIVGYNEKGFIIRKKQ